MRLDKLERIIAAIRNLLFFLDFLLKNRTFVLERGSPISKNINFLLLSIG